MRFAGLPRRSVIIVLGAAIAFSASEGIAQQPGASVTLSTPAPPATQDATTVSPLVVSAMVPVPNVGAGAPYFTLDELDATHQQAAAVERIDRRGLEDIRCPKFLCSTPKKEIFSGDFGLEALCDTAQTDQLTLVRLTEAATVATQAALDTRIAAARGEGSSDDVVRTELARQAAINAYVAARAAAQEAENRVSDYKDLPATMLGMSPIILNSEVERRSAERKANGGFLSASGNAGLTVTNLVARQLQGSGEPALSITGKINNSRKKPAPIPALSVSVLDRAGFPLKTQDFQADARKVIPAGGSIPFAFQMKPIPDHSEGLAVTLAASLRISQAHLPGCQIH